MTGGGILAERDNPSSIAGAIQELLGNAEIRSLMAKRGRERVVETFSWPRVAAATATVYAEIVERADRGRPTTTTTSASVGH